MFYTTLQMKDGKGNDIEESRKFHMHQDRIRLPSVNAAVGLISK